jgi:hypothetical protein
MTQPPHTGPQIDGDAPEDDDMADDTAEVGADAQDDDAQDDDGDEHPFTAEDYARPPRRPARPSRPR